MPPLSLPSSLAAGSASDRRESHCPSRVRRSCHAGRIGAGHDARRRRRSVYRSSVVPPCDAPFSGGRSPTGVVGTDEPGRSGGRRGGRSWPPSRACVWGPSCRSCPSAAFCSACTSGPAGLGHRPLGPLPIGPHRSGPGHHARRGHPLWRGRPPGRAAWPSDGCTGGSSGRWTRPRRGGGRGGLAVGRLAAGQHPGQHASLSLNAAIDQSRIIRSLDWVLPAPPSVFSQVQSFLSSEGFPPVFAQLAPASAGPVSLPGDAQLEQAVARAGASTVKIVGDGCGQIQEGSGFVVAPGLVVTNAHVVAGIAHPMVDGRHRAPSDRGRAASTPPTTWP